MRILILTPQVPRFPGSGGETRQYCLLRELAERHELTVMPAAWPEDPRLEVLRSLPVAVEPVFLGPGVMGPLTAPRGCEPLRTRLARRFPGLAAARRGALAWCRAAAGILWISPRRNAFARSARRAVQRKLEHLRLDAFDVVQVEQTEAGHWLSGAAARRSRLLVCHDVNTVIASRERGLRGGALQRLAASAEHWKTRRYEKTVAEAFHNCVVVSEPDRDALQALAPGVRAWVVPNGVDTRYFTPLGASESGGASLLFSGSMSWPANIDAMVQFCARVLPEVRRRCPDVTLTILGMEPSREVQALRRQPGVTVTGWVDDARPYLSRATVYVVPLRLGGGTRLKILEAMAMEKAVVSTSVGCEGLDVTAGKHLLVAEESEAFADTICSLLRDAGRRAALGRAGRALVEERYDWKGIARKQEEVYTAVAESSGAG